MSVERLTIRTCDDDICFSVDSDPDGAYDITDLCKYGYGDIALDVATRLAAYENALTTADGVMSPEEVKAMREDLKAAKENHVDDYMRLQSEISALKSERDELKRALEMAKQDIPRNCATCQNWQKDIYHTGVCHDCWYVENQWKWYGEQAKEALQK